MQLWAFLSPRTVIYSSPLWKKEEPMDFTHDDQNWNKLTYKEKNHQLFLKQKAVLDKFMERGAISKAQHDKSLHDLMEKKGEKERGAISQ